MDVHTVAIMSRFDKQIQFIIEIDRLKRVVRQSLLMDSTRKENSAEHSWHLAVMAIVLSEYANENNIDYQRVLQMLLVHDLVEIDAGDTYCYNKEKSQTQTERETEAAERIFNLLPSNQARMFHDLWNEFEAQTSAESRFADALDRLHPLLHNYTTKGKIWQVNGIKSSQVLEKMEPIKTASPFLWEYAVQLIEDAVTKGFLSK
jgi:putative hydrolases of HD superfamily